MNASDVLFPLSYSVQWSIFNTSSEVFLLCVMRQMYIMWNDFSNIRGLLVVKQWTAKVSLFVIQSLRCMFTFWLWVWSCDYYVTCCKILWQFQWCKLLIDRSIRHWFMDYFLKVCEGFSCLFTKKLFIQWVLAFGFRARVYL